MFHRQGVLIGLGTDWTPSGSINMLRELACASHLNDTHYGGFFSSRDLWLMATATEEETASVDEVEVADDGLMPPGEIPLSLMEARDIIGRRSAAGVLGFAKEHGVPVFKAGASRRVFRSHLLAAFRETHVV